MGSKRNMQIPKKQWVGGSTGKFPKKGCSPWHTFVKERRAAGMNLKQIAESWKQLSDGEGQRDGLAARPGDVYSVPPPPTVPSSSPADFPPECTPLGIGDAFYAVGCEPLKSVADRVKALSTQWREEVGAVVYPIEAGVVRRLPAGPPMCCALYGPGVCKEDLTEAEQEIVRRYRTLLSKLVLDGAEDPEEDGVKDLRLYLVALPEGPHGEAIYEFILLVAYLKKPYYPIFSRCVPSITPPEPGCHISVSLSNPLEDHFLAASLAMHLLRAGGRVERPWLLQRAKYRWVRTDTMVLEGLADMTDELAKLGRRPTKAQDPVSRVMNPRARREGAPRRRRRKLVPSSS